MVGNYTTALGRSLPYLSIFCGRRTLFRPRSPMQPYRVAIRQAADWAAPTCLGAMQSDAKRHVPNAWDWSQSHMPVTIYDRKMHAV